MTLTLQDLLSLATPDKEEVPLPGGGTVFVRCMTVGERDAMENAYQKGGKTNFRARVIAATLCNEEGVLLVTPEVGLGPIVAMPFPVAEPIVEAAIRVNRMGAQEKAELGKGSPETDTSGSSSGSA